jgi:hypothetical protein
MPLIEAILARDFAAERIHADDTTVPVLAKGKTRTPRSHAAPCPPYCLDTDRARRANFQRDARPAAAGLPAALASRWMPGIVF